MVFLGVPEVYGQCLIEGIIANDLRISEIAPEWLSVTPPDIAAISSGIFVPNPQIALENETQRAVAVIGRVEARRKPRRIDQAWPLYPTGMISICVRAHSCVAPSFTITLRAVAGPYS